MNDYSAPKCRALESELKNLATRIRSGRHAATSPVDAATVERAATLLQQYRNRLAAEIVTDLDDWFTQPEGYDPDVGALRPGAA